MAVVRQVESVENGRVKIRGSQRFFRFEPRGKQFKPDTKQTLFTPASLIFHVAPLNLALGNDLFEWKNQCLNVKTS